MTQVILTGSGNWIVPLDWNSAVNTVQGIGPGGNGFVEPAHGDNGTPGGGGAWAIRANVALTVGQSVPYVRGTPGNNTWFKDLSTLVAAFGPSGQSAQDTPGGQASNCVGDSAFSGGNSNYNQWQLATATAGGGGAAGPNGAGGTGGAPSGAGNSVPGVGGQGDNGFGGTGGTWSSGPVAGNPGTEYGTAGSGGGGSGAVFGGNGGNGGSYGAGAGAPAKGYTGSAAIGANGVIVITYTSKPIVPTLATGGVTTSTPCGGATAVTLNLSASNGASYNIYRSTTNGSGYTLLGSTNTTSFVDNTTVPTVTYYYVATAVLNGYESADSNQVTVTGINTITPNVSTDNVTWFGGGQSYPTAQYRVCYVNGAYQYDPRGFAAGRGYTVNSDFQIQNPAYENLHAGFWVTDGNGNIVPAPGNTTLYDTQSDCETGNAGLSVIYSHNGGKIGIFLSDVPLWDNVPGSPSPSFTLSIAGSVIGLSVSPIGPTIQGSARTLNWSCSNNPVSVSINQGIGSVAASGSLVVNPTVTTSYQISAQSPTPPNIVTTAVVTAYVGFPSPLQYLQASGNCAGDVLLSWGASQFTTNYIVQRSATLAENWTTLTTQAGTSYEDTTATPNEVYDYRVTPTDGLNIGVPAVVVGISNSTIPAVPSNLLAVPLNQRVQISASPSAGATSYNLWRGWATGDEALYISGLTAPSYADIDLQNGVPVFYTMTAENSCGTSAQSSEVSATPLDSLQSFATLNPPSTYWS